MKDPNDFVTVSMTFGSTRIVSEERWADNGDLLMGGYSIRYDENGDEISRTKWSQTVRVFMSGGDPAYHQTVKRDRAGLPPIPITRWAKIKDYCGHIFTKR